MISPLFVVPDFQNTITLVFPPICIRITAALIMCSNVSVFFNAIVISDEIGDTLYFMDLSHQALEKIRCLK
jgi:hypothetical protein